MSQIQHLAHVTVQADWQAVIQDILSNKIKEESFWISCYCKYEESVHGAALAAKNSGVQNACHVAGRNGVEAQYINSKTLQVSCPGLGIKKVSVKGYIIEFCPFESNSRIPKPIEAMNISPNHELYAVASANVIKVGELMNGTPRRELQGHIGDITTVQFFPSGQVLLSGAADFQLKVWSVLDGSNPVTLKGHTATITSTAIVDRGRNVLSSSKDGTIRLWECGSASTIATIDCAGSVSAIDLVELPDFLKAKDELSLDPREVSTKNKLLLAALDQGYLQAFDLGTKKEIFRTQALDAELLCCAYQQELGIIAVGNSKGVIALYNIKDTTETIAQFQRDENPILQLSFKLNDNGEETLCIATADGCIFETNPLSAILQSGRADIEVEYTGFDVDPVYSMKVASKKSNTLKGIIAAGRDGFVRRYE